MAFKLTVPDMPKNNYESKLFAGYKKLQRHYFCLWLNQNTNNWQNVEDSIIVFSITFFKKQDFEYFKQIKIFEYKRYSHKFNSSLRVVK